MALPTLTPEQREAALARARETRRARRALLGELAEGRHSTAQVLERAETDPVAGRIKALSLVRAMPGYGPARTDRVLAQAGIPATGGWAGWARASVPP